jgi:membrane-bound lytic murein transglycosylase MltF
MRHARATLPALLTVSALAAGLLCTAADLDEVKKRGELRVLAVVDEPKDEFITDRPGVGLDRELLEAFASLGPPGALAWAVRKEDRALLAALDEYVTRVRHTPTWSRLVVKYFGDEAPEILRRAREEAER